MPAGSYAFHREIDYLYMQVFLTTIGTIGHIGFTWDTTEPVKLFFKYEMRDARCEI